MLQNYRHAFAYVEKKKTAKIAEMEEKKASGKARLEHRSRLRTTQQPGDLQQKLLYTNLCAYYFNMLYHQHQHHYQRSCRSLSPFPILPHHHHSRHPSS
ncbi:hypothetical protein HBI56_190420 [Parastagonospora nodorum]|nr:hypothetical protein HBH52_162280 [Parastagonospora nodorum]KAH3997680.1 hypothetical protein HBI10_137000 [Parastagonospora nodorum]KAH4031404.1 hypothetical protein HBI09_124360 [Parastagonospora nodorum]KAH4047989.1 hypothetical protein HBH49_163010 [Parastagonospora nodorum]KAH4101921.1 hypothetical protein HBH46_134490 [Parastagonospora nodorum]